MNNGTLKEEKCKVSEKMQNVYGNHFLDQVSLYLTLLCRSSSRHYYNNFSEQIKLFEQLGGVARELDRPLSRPWLATTPLNIYTNFRYSKNNSKNNWFRA